MGKHTYEHVNTQVAHISKLTCTEHMKAPWMQTDFASIHKQASCSNTDRAHLNAPLLFVAFDSATRLRVIGP